MYNSQFTTQLLSHQVLNTHLFTTKTHVHNFTYHNVTINHLMFTCISQFNIFNLALIVNLQNNIIISKWYIILQFIVYSIYHLYTISIKYHAHNSTSHNVTIYHHRFTCISQINKCSTWCDNNCVVNCELYNTHDFTLVFQTRLTYWATI